MARLGISYTRVSSGRQARDGRDGLDRQGALFDAFCDRHGLQPAPDRLLDAGVSAFKGAHRRHGALGQLLEAARAGTIPAGSVLVIEDVDRLSREVPTDALRLLLDGVFAQGLALGVCRFDSVITEADFNANVGAALQLQLAIGQAHEYSARLSSRVLSAWKRSADAAQQGQKLKRLAPFWCDWDAAASDFVLNEHAALVQRMVQLSIEGQGTARIAALLNAEGIRTISNRRNHGGRTWSFGYIRQILTSRSLIGEATLRVRGEPDRVIPSYFPAAVTVADFDASLQAIHSRGQRRGRSGRGTIVANILMGVLHCPCGRPMQHLQRTSKGRPYRYLRCIGRANGLCTISPRCWSYNEEALLQMLSRQRWADFFSRSTDTSQRRDLQQRILAAEAAEAQARGRADRARANLIELLTQGGLTATLAATLGQVQLDAEQQADQLAQGLAKLRAELRALDARPTGQEAERELLGRIQGFMATDRHDPQQRQRLNAWLAAQGIHITMHLQGGQDHPLLVLRHADGRDAVELHQQLADGDVVHVKAAPQAMHQLWQEHGQVVIQPDGSQALVLDGGST